MTTVASPLRNRQPTQLPLHAKLRNPSTTAEPERDRYARVYDALTELRESFHRSGRLDDSNAKLDEVAKLFAAYLAFKKGEIKHFPQEDSPDLVAELIDAFAQTVALPHYRPADAPSIFGSHPRLALRPGDDTLARDIVRLVRDSVDCAFDGRTSARSFDVLNESFGHFVRDNFRGNIEDAQYMTPPEVVDFMADMVLTDVTASHRENPDPDKHWTVLDPSCGVGSFLAAIYQRATSSEWCDPSRLRLFGQDKVERMVRLSTINLELFDVAEHRVTMGNSLERGSPLDELNGTVDIILTNPPFGARFASEYVSTHCGDNTPIFARSSQSTRSIDSELLFIDRNLRLLREGGRLLIVVPDGVVSARGTAALLRQKLARVARLRAVIALPSVTFAQAGTRTKTAILYLQKTSVTRSAEVFMGISKDLGFQVSSRKGVQVKSPSGTNDLLPMLASYRNTDRSTPHSSPGILCATPSCVTVSESTVLKGSWTPNHYSVARIGAVKSIRADESFNLIPLRDLVDFLSKSRRVEAWRKGMAFVSVLHILGEGFVDAGGAICHAPKTPGVPVEPGELLVSRINPRIPRICVLPDLGVKMLCSSEFEVMKPKGKIDAYTLAYLLQTDAVQSQITSLTCGTSASHNRIRTSELANVIIPIPKAATRKAKALAATIRDYRATLRTLGDNAVKLAAIRARDTIMFPQL